MRSNAPAQLESDDRSANALSVEPYSPKNNHGLQHSEQQQHQCWEYESLTPMTTRPHFNLQTSVRRRGRSVSLGAIGDRQEVWGVTESSSLLPPYAIVVDGGVIEGFEHVKDENGGDLRSTSSCRKESPKREQTKPIWVSVMYGMINATIVLPVLMSFGSIIYRDNAFSPYMPVLVKLTVVSGVVHQLCFSSCSSLPFAVGQVQDAGLIFLSGMASKIAASCRKSGHDDETMLATVTVGLSLGTALLGCGLVLIGYLRLGQYVQLLPTR